MQKPNNVRVAQRHSHPWRSQWAALAAATAAIAVGILVLLGWALDAASLKSIFPDCVSMKANTAVGLILGGGSLALLVVQGRLAWVRRLSQAMASTTALLGLLSLSEYLLGLDLGLDQLLFVEPADAVGTLAPGRMAPATAVCFILTGLALLLTGSARAVAVSQRLALLTGLNGLLALTGYLYGAAHLYGVGYYAQMAVHTAIGFVILSLGLLLVHPKDGLMRLTDRNTMGGWLVRRLVPLAVVAPLVLGWLRVQGERHGVFDGPFGVALMMMILVVILTSMIFWTARTLTGVDTIRQQAERQLSQNEKRYRQLFNGISDAVFLHGVDSDGMPGRFLEVNDAACSRLGYSRAELLQMSPMDIDAPEGRAMIPQVMKDWKTTGQVVWEGVHMTRDGCKVPVEISNTVLELGATTLMLSTARDITERKKAQEALQEISQFNQQIIVSAQEGIIVYGPDLKYRTWNPFMEQMTGLPASDVVGRHPYELFPFLRETGFAGRLQQALAGELAGSIDFPFHVPQTGRAGWASDTSAPLRNAKGEIVGVIATVRDITERKHAEDEVRLAKAAAERANAAKSVFLANMSHEIRTPMTAILGFAEMIDSSMDCCVGCPEHSVCRVRSENKQAIEVIRRNGEHLLGLINDILDISKIEAGRLSVERVLCHPVQLVEEVLSLMRVRAVEKGLSLEAAYEFPLPETIESDPARLRQILMNLVANAVKFTERGNVKIAVRWLAQEESAGPSLIFSIQDTGIGMTPEQMQRVFMPFVQADASTTRHYGGTGLGLSISKRLAEALGGDIQVCSQPGEGSTFTFALKAAMPQEGRMLDNVYEAAHVSLHAPAARQLVAGLRGRILLAEDGTDNQTLISALLHKAGAEVDVAGNGRVAMDMALSANAEGQPYRVVLMDMQMPEMDGYEATRLLRRAGYPGAIIALTAHAMAEDRDKCLAAGCDDYATKPVDRNRLLGMLARYMSAAEASPATLPVPVAPARVEASMSAFADDPDMADVVRGFVHRLPGQLAAMEDALTNNCHEELRRLAHRLKGAGGGYGYPGLTEQARLLEDAARLQDREAAKLALKALRDSIRAIIAGCAPAPVGDAQP